MVTKKQDSLKTHFKQISFKLISARGKGDLLQESTC